MVLPALANEYCVWGRVPFKISNDEEDFTDLQLNLSSAWLHNRGRTIVFQRVLRLPTGNWWAPKSIRDAYL
ncbi:hypothetical protein M404DRAFT_1000159 [Pisolithus tinctorius Marx 270]|uniref:Uncharacterized protein n=1 Tax=Pisolithus tinctorius Marx 270 TaxID=870435 RepID=A0A0C3J7X0_PISTI|nr:hypothetical protein M404DRAFT_1000159 [Pisolithus tinctorius Marx 270]